MQDDDLPTGDDPEGDDEPSSFGDPLHPDDRLWRHPSEMRSVPPPGARSIPDTVDFAPAPRRRIPWSALVASSLVGASAALIAVLVTGMGDRVVERIVQPVTTLPADSTVPASTSLPDQATEAIVTTVMPSVAQLAVTSADTTVDGSAIVIRPDGYLLTDAQLVSGAESLVVTLHDGTSQPGEIVALDPVTELAVVRIPRDDLVPARLGDPAALQVGQVAVALGSHEGGGPSVSSGVISALDERSTGDNGTPLYGMIRFDAPVPTGVAGGPLVTEDGQVVGVTSKAQGGSAFGWATPIDDAEQIATDLITDGHTVHPWLGVEGRRTAEGPMIMAVAEGSPAAQAGLQAEDVLVSVNGVPLSSMAGLVTVIRDHEPGDSVTITYRRDGMQWDCVAVLGERDVPGDSG